MRVGVLPFVLGASFANLTQSWQAADEAGFDAIWTLDHSTSTSDLRPAWEASSLLVAMAAQTRTIAVGVLVFDVLLRHPFHVAGSVAVAQALSGGRVRVGLGVGDEFTKLDHDALGIPFLPFGERVRKLEACCKVLPALWRGETVTEPVLGIHQAALGPVDLDLPPLIVGGGSNSVMEVAVRHAQGWNLFTQDPDEFARRVEILSRVEMEMDRRDPLTRSVYLFVDRVERDLVVMLDDFTSVGAEEVALVVLDPNRDSILELARRVL